MNKYDFLGLLLVICILVVGLGGGYAAAFYSCKTKAEIMKMNYQYGFIIGCMVEFEKGKWGPVGSIRSMQ